MVDDQEDDEDWDQLIFSSSQITEYWRSTDGAFVLSLSNDNSLTSSTNLDNFVSNTRHNNRTLIKIYLADIEDKVALIEILNAILMSERRED